MTRSISFERAADYYDVTRALPPDASAALTELLARELLGRGLTLEIGVGTGLVGLPLARAGIRLVGVDISRAMLRKLAEKAGPDLFPLVIADAVDLPFPDALFGAAVASHVFHLIAEWRRALDELFRVLRPGGLLLLDLGGRHDNLSDVDRHFWSLAPRRTESIRQEVEAALPAIMAARGARKRDLPVIEARYRQTIAERLANLEAGRFAGCWELDGETIARAAAAARAWALARYGDLEAEREVRQPVVWTAYDLAT